MEYKTPSKRDKEMKYSLNYVINKIKCAHTFVCNDFDDARRIATNTIKAEGLHVTANNIELHWLNDDDSIHLTLELIIGAEQDLEDAEIEFMQKFCPIAQDICKLHLCHSYIEGYIQDYDNLYVVIKPRCNCALVTGYKEIEKC